MTVSIRPHHLLCMLTYLGRGYTPDFVKNYDQIIQRLNKGEALSLVTGPDDICAPMLAEAGCHCHNDSVRVRDEMAARQIGAVLKTSLVGNMALRLTTSQVLALRAAFANGAIRAGCEGCEWYELCSNIAAKKFRGCHLAPPD
ncbi:DUF1284 domain-containing protein [uncultured Roseibium sp.]|uniref:DUF1284 domain-containing protein n=1 Tax=uncultured Roseibium sp. TaxID=1936171 RepID=UPI00260D3BB2|nr:DUF1284 domain-containing protein [uncultured Roseibium sp.]